MNDIYHYTDYRRYLEDWFTVNTGRVSRRAFARRVHCSPSMVVGVLKGRNNLDAARAEHWAKKGLRLDGDSTRYLVALVGFAHAEGLVAKQAAWERIRTTRHFREAQRLTGDMYQLFARWATAATLELARCAGFRDDPQWIAGRLWPRVSAAEVAETLDLLERLGCLQRREDGSRYAPPQTVVTEHEVDPGVVNLALVGLHKDSMARASLALEEIPYTDRHFATLALPVDAARQAELKRAIERFQEEVMQICAEGDSPPDRVVQLNVQLFPMTLPVDPAAAGPARS